MSRCSALAWTAAVVVLGGGIAALALRAPWSWLVMLGAFGVVVACAERMMARFEKVARVSRRRRK